MNYKLRWRGREVIQLSEKALVAIMADIALVAVNESKNELYPGHGRVTSTLRRSIQAWLPPELRGRRMIVAIGSDLEYALAIHQGWQSGYPGLHGHFEGYHYLTNGVDKTRPQIRDIVWRHRLD